MESIIQPQIDIRPLLPNYVPEELIGRTDEIDFLENEIQNFMKHGACTNIHIDGVTGSGKTATLKYFEKKYPSLLKYVNCMGLTREKEFLSTISDTKPRTTTEAIQKAIDYFTEHRNILVIDEIDKIADTQTWNIINHIYRETAIPIFIISNRKDIDKTIPEDAHKTLLFHKVYFDSYNIETITEILQQRLNLSRFYFEDGCEVNILGVIAHHAYESGSARTALDILRFIVLDANTTPTTKDIKNYNDRLTMHDLTSQLRRLKPIEQRLLYVIALTQQKRSKNKYLTTGSLQDMYESRFQTISRGHFSTVLNNLNNYWNLDITMFKSKLPQGPGQTTQVVLNPSFADQLLQALSQINDEFKEC